MALPAASRDDPPHTQAPQPEFPSGSNWGASQLELLTFSLEPQVHDFADFSCGHHISSECASVLDRLRIGFGVDEDDWESDIPAVGYGQFYENLSHMLPQLRPRQHTPRKSAIRSNTDLPSSSVKVSSSPWSTGTVKRPAPISLPSTPSKAPCLTSISQTPKHFEGDADDADEEPSPAHIAKRQRQSSPQSPGLPFTISPSTQVLTTPKTTTSAPLHSDLLSSQTDSTFEGSDSHSTSESVHSNGDRPETDVTFVFHSLLNRICREHNNSDGYRFTAGNHTDTLTIPICGDFPKSIPDLYVRVEKARKILHILDFETKRLMTQMTKEEKFAQEVAHMLGRANLMKSYQVSDYYDVFLLTAHNMELSILTCRVSNKYLHRLQTRLPESAKHTPVIHRYGPVDIFDTAQRVDAVCKIYKLMLDQVTAVFCTGNS